MVTVGLLALSVGLAPVAVLFALGRLRTLELVYIRVSWVPGGGACAPGDVRATHDAGAQLCLHHSAAADLYREPLFRNCRRDPARRTPAIGAASRPSPGHGPCQPARRPARRIRHGHFRVVLCEALSRGGRSGRTRVIPLGGGAFSADEGAVPCASRRRRGPRAMRHARSARQRLERADRDVELPLVGPAPGR